MFGADIRSQLANAINGSRVRVDSKYFAPHAHQVHEVAAASAAGIEHAHVRPDVAAHDLIEEIDVDVAELLF